MPQFAVILPAAGRSTRFGDVGQKKVYADLEGRAVWLQAANPFLNHKEVSQLIVAIAPEDRELFDRRYQASVAFLNITLVEGGAERSDTIARSLERVDPSVEFVAIHDAARPCLTPELVEKVFAAAASHGAALLAIPVTDTLKRSDAKGFTSGTVPRDRLYRAQTPQVFRRDWLMEAYGRRMELGPAVTDDTQLVEALGHHCAIVEGSSSNLKVTTAEDLHLASAILRSRAKASQSRPSHPFADEQSSWSELPKLKPRDVFGP